MQLPSRSPRLPPSPGAWVVSSWPVPSLAICSHSGFSLSPGVKNAPVRLVSRHPTWTPHQPVLLALRLCFLHFLRLPPESCPWPWPVLSVHFCWHGIYSVAVCPLAIALLLEACLSTLSGNTSLSKPRLRYSWPRDTLIIGMIFRTLERNNSPPCIRGISLSVVLKVSSLDLQH